MTRFKGFIAPLLGAPGSSASAATERTDLIGRAAASAKQLGAHLDERSRLRMLAAEETARVSELDAQLTALNVQRIDALTEDRVSSNPESKATAEALLADCARVRQEIEDASLVKENIGLRIHTLDQEIAPLKAKYRGELGAYLSGIYRGHIEDYNKLAPELAETIYKIAATARVMRRYLAGDSSGWDGTVLLPGMQAGNGRTIPPILDAGSREFEDDANSRMEAILEQLKEAGFIWRLDLD